MPVASEEVRAWSAALETEALTWPSVNRKPMFGLVGLYRRDQIFAALPRTRCLGLPNSLAFKLENASPRVLAKIEHEPRIQTTIMKARRWYLFELSSATDLRDALDWLHQAYKAASTTA
jgi:TfoX/Sxy family transcriptional regulator of competence genes